MTQYQLLSGTDADASSAMMMLDPAAAAAAAVVVVVVERESDNAHRVVHGALPQRRHHCRSESHRRLLLGDYRP